MKKTIVLAMALIMGMAFAPMAEAAVNEANLELLTPAKKKTAKKTTKKTTKKSTKKTTTKATTSKTATTATTATTAVPTTTETTQTSSSSNSGSLLGGIISAVAGAATGSSNSGSSILSGLSDLQLFSRRYEGSYRRYLDLYRACCGVLKQQCAEEHRWQGCFLGYREQAR